MSPRGSKSIPAPRSSDSDPAASPTAAGMWLLSWGMLRCVVVFWVWIQLVGIDVACIPLFLISLINWFLSFVGIVLFSFSN